MASKPHQISVDSLVAMLLEDRKLARKNNQSAAAVAAVMGVAKITGHIVDRSKTDLSSDGKPIEPVINITIGAAQEAQAFTERIARMAKRNDTDKATPDTAH